MSNRKLVILSIVAALMIVWAVIQSHISNLKTPVRALSGNSYLIQGLDTGNIATIVVGTGKNAVRLIRQGNHFLVGNKDNYPAETGKINKLITSCLDIRTAELITSDPANHKDLQVSKDNPKGVIKFLKKDGQIITGVVIGKTDPQTHRTYVRLISSDDVYTTANAPQLRKTAMDYIDKEIVNISRSDVAEVTVTGPDGSYTLKVDDSNDNNIILENIPAGKKLKQSECKNVLAALSYLSFSDVKKESSEKGKLKFENTYVCKLKDLNVYTFNITKTGGKTYIKCHADYTGEAQVIKEKRVESKEELKNKEAKLLAHDRAVDFTKNHQGWLYEIPEWKAKNLTKKMSELLEEKKEVKKPATPPSSGSNEKTKSKQPK